MKKKTLYDSIWSSAEEKRTELPRRHIRANHEAPLAGDDVSVTAQRERASTYVRACVCVMLPHLFSTPVYALRYSHEMWAQQPGVTTDRNITQTGRSTNKYVSIKYQTRRVFFFRCQGQTIFFVRRVRKALGKKDISDAAPVVGWTMLSYHSGFHAAEQQSSSFVKTRSSAQRRGND